jgi:hypothetical protein
MRREEGGIPELQDKGREERTNPAAATELQDERGRRSSL